MFPFHRVVEMPDKRIHISGSCNQCGACCEVVYLHTELNNILMEFYEARGLQVISTGKNRGVVVLYQPCQMLTSDNQCQIQDYKTKICMDYPLELEGRIADGEETVYLPAGCGFDIQCT